MSRAWKFGDDVSTDAIIPGRYLTMNKPEELAEYVFESERNEFASEVSPGDIIVAGENFGCGSSREHAPLAIKGAGVDTVIAESFARIFFRNSINLGLMVIISSEASEIDDGDEIEVEDGKIINKTKNEEYKIEKPPRFIENIVENDGLLKYVKKEML
ncbi:3-isopropylmalate dehydratase small subunit [Methanonatronarchaeum sp. AMET6-2]|uniref:3-isopropylmalate dehydratase small subunit n=1 Tax=Methanonatronarchaeum sp. AMET6-2 TaxID=2933293 RepID=UPI00121F2CC4|nr:3-isopropylmalate dehydratase small subunit [Methanonatronarchaeum sp. AMET6-2]RZN62992.1 MAG: 3-isopropylmalate dehydratase small subunit [Methanonatronarchaeia archaeon]UOY09975.1 3-isopropylmalate dehydratase small subunit [Methanonatronarchaeum sp. AMET6-2]